MTAPVAALLALISALCCFYPGEAGGTTSNYVVDSSSGGHQGMNGMRSRRPMVRTRPRDKAHYVVDAAGGGDQEFGWAQPAVDGSGSGSAPPVLNLLGQISNERSASRQESFAMALQGRGRLRTCAVVGSGRSLANASLGEEIDAHDWVWRQNKDNSSHKIAADTGLRSDVIMAGHVWWPHCLPSCWNTTDNRDAVIIAQFDRTKHACSNATACPGFKTDLVTKKITELNARSLEVKRRPGEDYGHDIYMLADGRLDDLGRRLTLASGAKLHCQPFRNLTKDGLVENSAGFLSLLLATLVCDEVDVYGFGPDAATDGKYSISDHGGDWMCNHDFKAEHDIARSWSATGRCPAHPREYTMPGGAGEERLGQDVLEKIRSVWTPNHDAQDAELLDRVCQTSRVTFHE